MTNSNTYEKLFFVGDWLEIILPDGTFAKGRIEHVEKSSTGDYRYIFFGEDWKGQVIVRRIDMSDQPYLFPTKIKFYRG